MVVSIPIEMHEGLPQIQCKIVGAAKSMAAPSRKSLTMLAGGMIFGDLPPTEAFPIGGTNSVRGYAEGAVGSARHFATTHTELRCPLSGPFEVRYTGVSSVIMTCV